MDDTIRTKNLIPMLQMIVQSMTTIVHLVGTRTHPISMIQIHVKQV